jgi:alkyl sulfatase BDS1-like metallo-beta-lactamase superfamily hydrolase
MSKLANKLFRCSAVLMAMTVCAAVAVSTVAAGQTAETLPELTAEVKAASVHTRERQEQLRKNLPFSDERDFAEQSKGFIAAPESKEIVADDGHVVWSMGKY